MTKVTITVDSSSWDCSGVHMRYARDDRTLVIAVRAHEPADRAFNETEIRNIAMYTESLNLHKIVLRPYVGSVVFLERPRSALLMVDVAEILLQCSASLQELRIEGIQDVEWGAWIALCKALQFEPYPNLSTLSVALCRMHTEGICLVIEACSMLHSLNTLDLSNNDAGDSAALSLCGMLTSPKHNSSLIKLKLDGNRLSTIADEQLAVALATHGSVLHLDELQSHGIRLVHAALAVERNRRSLRLQLLHAIGSRTNMDASVIKKILKLAHLSRSTYFCDNIH